MEKPNYFKINNEQDKIAGLYNIGNTIGRGHYAVVKEAKHVFTQEKVAIKVIDKTKLDAQSREHLFSEVMCMKLVQHPNVVRLYEVIDTVNKLYLVLELGDAGDLYDYIMKYDNGLPEIQAKRYFRQIVQAIAYCHNLHVVHRDLKPENVVFFEKLELVKLTDFGFSNKFTPGQTLQTSCGSLAYSAPEILLGDAYDAPKVDIWSLGVILFMLVCGRLPFDETNDSETLSRIMDCRYELPTKLSPNCQNLIRSMLIRAPDQRASLDQILNHDWMDRDLLSLGDAYAVPLISQKHLSVEEHVDILTKMSEGKLGSVEDIQMTLDQNEYSYITATYFLLAERKLKRQHYENFYKMKLLQLEAEAKMDQPLANADVTATSTMTATQSINDKSGEERMRRFSMILEDEEVEEEEEELEAMISLASVREELVLTVPMTTNDGPSASGTSAPFNSRCCSRLSGPDNGNDGNSSNNDALFLESFVVSRFSNQSCRHNHHRSHSTQHSKRNNRCRSAIYNHRSMLYPSHSLSSISQSQPQSQPQRQQHQPLRPRTVGLDDTNQQRHRATSHSQSTNSRKRRSYPVLLASPSHSNSDVSDTENSMGFMLRGYQELRRVSVPKTLSSKAPPPLSHSHKMPLTPDWMNSCSSIDSDRYYSRRLRMRSSGSRPSSTGAALSLSDDEQMATMTTVPSSPTMTTVGNIGNVNTAVTTASNTAAIVTIPGHHRDICAPIHEEDVDELIRSRTYIDTDTAVTIDNDDEEDEYDYEDNYESHHRLNSSFRSVSVDCRLRRESIDGRWQPLLATGTSGITNRPSLYSQLAQSNFSLSSFASSLRDSRAMMTVVRGAFELQCLANRVRLPTTASGSAAVNGNCVTVSADASGRHSRCEFASVSSLPATHHVHSDHDDHDNNGHHPVSVATVAKDVVKSHSNENNSSTKAVLGGHGGSLLLRASSTVGRKARFILSCCRTS